MVSVDFVGVRWGGIGQIAKSGVGTPPSDPHKIRTDDMVEVDLGGPTGGTKSTSESDVSLTTAAHLRH